MTIYRRDVLGEFGRTEKLGLDINRVHLEVRRNIKGAPFILCFRE